jgi:rubrerythrin
MAMEINGSGGSLIEKKYRLDVETTWKLGLETAMEMQVDVESRDDKEHLLRGSFLSEEKTFLFGHPKRKEFAFSVQPLSEGCQVIVDIHKKHLEVYSFKPQNKETGKFIALLEQKIEMFLSHQICPACGALVQRDAVFCPYCGASLKTRE